MSLEDTLLIVLLGYCMCFVSYILRSAISESAQRSIEHGDSATEKIGPAQFDQKAERDLGRRNRGFFTKGVRALLNL